MCNTEGVNYMIRFIKSVYRGTVTFVFLLIYASASLHADEAESHIIEFDDFTYNPSQLEVAVGDTVVWQGNFTAHPLQSSTIPDGADPWGPVSSGTEYSYVVEVEGTYNYHCTLHGSTHNMTGSFSATVTSIEDREKEIANEFRLVQNYPNPFNPTTEIEFVLPEQMQVTLDVYAIHGQHVATLIDGVRSAGSHSVTFDAAGIPSGIYLYRLKSELSVQTKRMIYIR